jgi:predicted acyl esterase
MTDTGGIIVERDLMVPARDGVMLATDVYRPTGPGPFPVLFERTPYGKSAPRRSERTATVARPRSRAEVAAYFQPRLRWGGSPFARPVAGHPAR